VWAYDFFIVRRLSFSGAAVSRSELFIGTDGSGIRITTTMHSVWRLEYAGSIIFVCERCGSWTTSRRGSIFQISHCSDQSVRRSTHAFEYEEQYDHPMVVGEKGRIIGVRVCKCLDCGLDGVEAECIAEDIGFKMLVSVDTSWQRCSWYRMKKAVK